MHVLNLSINACMQKHFCMHILICEYLVKTHFGFKIKKNKIYFLKYM
jgi:hypothetical protein